MTTPSTQQASTEVSNSAGHTDAEFQAAMAMIEKESGDDSTPVIDSAGVPMTDQVEEFEDAAAQLEAKSKPEVPKTPNADLDRQEKLLEKQRQIWQQQKQIQKHNMEMEKLRQENEQLKKGMQAPPKKGAEKSELEETIDLDNDAEEWLTPSQLREKIKKELKEEFAKENTERMSKAELEAEVDMHKDSISSHLTTNADKYPAIETFTDIDESMEQIFRMQEMDYRAKAEKYGHEWAEENMATIEQAADAYEKHVAQKYGPKLKSERAQKFFKQHLSTQQESTQKTSPLDGEVRNPTPSDAGPTDWDERIKWMANKL